MRKHKRKMKLTTLSKLLLAAAAIAVAAVLYFTIAPGRGKSPAELQSAAADAEKSGDYRLSADLFAAAALKATPSMRLHEAHKGQASNIKPSVWRGEIEKYMKWLAEPSGAAGGAALDGLLRCVEKFEPENTANAQPPQPLDTLPAFTREWNQAFNPPPSEMVEWGALVNDAYGRKFSILCLASPMNYVYDVAIVSRKNTRGVNFTLYSESKVYVPLPPAEYVMLVQSKLEQKMGQKDMLWKSAYSAFTVAVADEPALMPIDLKTKVWRKQ